ncbi:MAG: FtsX-like permease family protein [Oscillospiraceae bacterium]|nr:FtsX-like permease family protein [Oscillospiraceae bacterium]
MKPYFKNCMREIRGSFGRFMAILAITALGVAMFVGLRVSKQAMIKTGDIYIAQSEFYDWRAVSTLGWEAADLAALRNHESVETAEAFISVDFICSEMGGAVLHAMTLGEQLNKTRLLAGRMPQNSSECLGDTFCFDEDDIGTTVTVAPENDTDVFDSFTHRTYTIVGLCDSPFYMSYNRGTTAGGGGSVAGFVCLREDGFATDYYTELYLTVKGSEGDIYTDEYVDSVQAHEDALLGFFEQRAAARYERIFSEAQTELADGEQKLADGWQEYYDAKDTAARELADARRQIEDGERELAEGKAELEKNGQELAEAEQTVNTHIAEIEDALSSVEFTVTTADAVDAVLDMALQEGRLSQEDYDDAKQFVQQLYDNGTVDPNAPAGETVNLLLDMAHTLGYLDDETYAEARSLLSRVVGPDGSFQMDLSDETAAKGQLDAAHQLGFITADEYAQATEAVEALFDLYAARDEIEAGKQQLQQGWYSYNTGLQELQDGYRAYLTAKADAEKQLTDAFAELTEAQLELDDAKEKFAKLKEPTVYLLDRSSTMSYSTLQSDTDIVHGISHALPIFFFAVAALICSTTMSRMVADHRTQIGTFKALGYGRAQIMGKYLLYAGGASFFGWAVGFGLGSWIFPTVIWTGYSIMYFFSPDITIVWNWGLGAVSLAASLLCCMGTAYLSCRSALAEVPAQLMRPRAPQSGSRTFLERIGFLWNRLSFLGKVSARNIFRYKKRLVMMILGVGGCTALLLTGFGVKDSVQNIVDYQFDEIALFDITVSFSEHMSSEMQQAFLAESGLAAQDALFVHQSSIEVNANGASQDVYFTAAPDGLDGFIDLHSGKRPVAWPQGSDAVISNGIADALSLSVGDTLTIRDSADRELTFTVGDICDNYVFTYFYANSEGCAAQLGEAPEVKTALVIAAAEEDVHALAAKLAGCENVSSVSVNADMRGTVGSMLQSLDYIVLLIVVCAAALVFIVLYNLTNINITERIREIATIKVLGFTQSETAQYVFRENIILSIVGAVVGLPMGRLFHWYIMEQVKITMMSFPVRVLPVSYAISFVLTVIFALCVNGLLVRKLQNIDMAQSLKSVE